MKLELQPRFQGLNVSRRCRAVVMSSGQDDDDDDDDNHSELSVTLLEVLGGLSLHPAAL